jgi:hypothetical protein
MSFLPLFSGSAGAAKSSDQPFNDVVSMAGVMEGTASTAQTQSPQQPQSPTTPTPSIPQRVAALEANQYDIYNIVNGYTTNVAQGGSLASLQPGPAASGIGQAILSTKTANLSYPNVAGAIASDPRIAGLFGSGGAPIFAWPNTALNQIFQTTSSTFVDCTGAAQVLNYTAGPNAETVVVVGTCAASAVTSVGAYSGTVCGLVRLYSHSIGSVTPQLNYVAAISGTLFPATHVTLVEIYTMAPGSSISVGWQVALSPTANPATDYAAVNESIFGADTLPYLIGIAFLGNLL